MTRPGTLKTPPDAGSIQPRMSFRSRRSIEGLGFSRKRQRSMGTRFAGSRMSDERRRRRLAVETDLQPAVASSLPRAKRSASVQSAMEEFQNETQPTEFPFRKLISPRIWKHWAIGCLGLIVAVVILATGFLAADGQVVLAPGLTKPFAFQTPRMATFYSSVLLLLAGQLAFLIWWVRSCSLTDFAGRYSIWMWTAIVWCIFGASVATDAHLAWSETAIWCWNINVWNRETLCWLFPALVIGNNLFWSLQRDMKFCRSSVLLLWFSAVCLVISASLTVLYTEFENSNWHRGVALSAAMIGHLSLFLSMLFHARFVIHESAEPPPIRTSWLFRVLKRIGQIRIGRLRRAQVLELAGETRKQVASKSARSKGKESASNPSESTEVKRKTKAAKTTAKRRTPKVTLRTDSGAEDDHTDSNVDDQDAARRRPGKAASRRRASSASADSGSRKASKSQATVSDDSEATQDIRIDAMSEMPDLKGMSKKQRRQVRKQWREQQRAAGH